MIKDQEDGDGRAQGNASVPARAASEGQETRLSSSLGEPDLWALQQSDDTKKKQKPTISFFGDRRKGSQSKVREKKHIILSDKNENDANNVGHYGSNNKATPKLRLSQQARSGIPLPVAQENPPATTCPGAYPIPGDGRQQCEQDQEEELELVDLESPQQVGPLDDSECTEAWPVSEPASRAMSYQGALQNHGSKKGLGKLFFVAIVAIVTAILVASAALTPLILTNDPNKIQHTRIRSTIIKAYGEEYFNNKEKQKALHWITYEDPRNSFGIEEKGQPINLIQRFSMVASYFQTSSQNPWIFCNPPVDQQSDTCFHYTDPRQSNGVIGTRWLTAASECQWMGVFCAGGDECVTGLVINRNNMSGTFPKEELAKLTQLKLLNLAKNNLTGSLPKSIFKDKQYTGFNLNENKLTGRVPFQALMMPSFTMIGLRGNQLTGSIPTQIGLIRGSHVWLDLSHNLLTGSIPKEIHAVAELNRVDLDHNLLTGTLPSTLGHLSRMESFSASGNPIHGYIPSQLGLVQLTYLAIERTHISGSIPEEFYHINNLRDLWLSDCSLTGTISTRIGQLKILKVFRVANNNLHGTIPKEISFAVTKLESLQLQGNSNLTGSVPDLFCSQIGQGITVAADCTPNASTEVPPVYCPKHCCSICCDAESKICLEQGA